MEHPGAVAFAFTADTIACRLDLFGSYNWVGARVAKGNGL
jgi:hypothetical protein